MSNQKRVIECTLSDSADRKFYVNITYPHSEPVYWLVFKVSDPCHYVSVSVYWANITSVLNHILGAIVDRDMKKLRPIRFWATDSDGNDNWFALDFLEDKVRIDTGIRVYEVTTNPWWYAEAMGTHIVYFAEDINRRKRGWDPKHYWHRLPRGFY